MIIFTWYDLSKLCHGSRWVYLDYTRFMDTEVIWMNLIKYIEDKERYRCECGKCYDGRSKCFMFMPCLFFCAFNYMLLFVSSLSNYMLPRFKLLWRYDPSIHCCHLNPYLDIFLLMLGPFLLCYLFSLYPVHSYCFIIFIW